MSRPINEQNPLKDVVAPIVTDKDFALRLRAEHYQVAMREEGEAREVVRKAHLALAEAEEALSDASVQLTLTRDGLFKACGL